MNFESELRIKIIEAVQTLYSTALKEKDVVLQPTRKEFEGDITLVVFGIAKASKKNPEVTGNEIGEYLQKNSSFVSGFNVIKGFLNVVIADQSWLTFFNKIEKVQSSKFSGSMLSPTLNIEQNNSERSAPLIMVEYSSPNTNKPLHLGHIRNNLLGHSVSELLAASGNRVMKVNLVNDRGIHICKSMLAWKKWGKGETPESTDTKGDHLVGKYYVLFDKKYKEEIERLVRKGADKEDAEKNAPLMLEIQDMLRKWEAGDKETLDLWSMMNDWVYKGFEESYHILGVTFDKIYYESKTYLHGKKIVEEGLKNNVFYKKEDGSVWIDLTDVGLDHKVLLRGDGTSVYITQDLGTAQLRFDEYPGLQQLIYVVGNEQEYHFKVLKEIFKKLGRSWADGLYHLSYGMVDLPSGKMKSREGTVVDADDLIKEIIEEAELNTKALGKIDDFNSDEAKKLYHTIGMGALKYFILKVDPKKRMLFNPAESIDLNGNTGPFIQYTYARIRSVMRKGNEMKLEAGGWKLEIGKEEKELIKQIYYYKDVLKEAASNHSPALIANYAYELAKSYNHFYHECPIIDPADADRSAFRLKLSETTSSFVAASLKMLGIEAPERM